MKLDELQQQFLEKSDRQVALSALGEDLGDAEAAELIQVVSDMTNLRRQIETAKGVEGALANGRDLQEWAAKTGRPGVPHSAPQAGIGTLPNGTSVLGWAPDGHIDLAQTSGGGMEHAFSEDAYRHPKEAFDAFRTDEYNEAFWKLLARGGSYSQLSADDQRILEKGRDRKDGFLAPSRFLVQTNYWRQFQSRANVGLGMLPAGKRNFQMEISTDVDGGYLNPEEVMARLIAKEPTPTRVQQYVTQYTTSRDALAIPKVNYASAAGDDASGDLFTTGMRVTWAGETPAANAVRATKPQFGMVRIPVWTALISLPVTLDLLEDAIIDIEGWLSSKFGETAELLRDQMILNGSGVGQPSGILANPNGTNQPATIVTGNASALTLDGLIDLTEAIPEQYDEMSRLVFNKTNTGKAIRKLKDGDGRPVVSYGFNDNGYAGGRYKEVNGYPYIWSGFMPNVGASTNPIIFGDLTGYTMVNRIGFSLRVLDQVLAEQNQVLLLGRIRFGGEVTEPWRLRVQTCST